MSSALHATRLWWHGWQRVLPRKLICWVQA